MRNSFKLWLFIVSGAHRALRDETLDTACRADVALKVTTTPFFFGAANLLATKRQRPP